MKSNKRFAIHIKVAGLWCLIAGHAWGQDMIPVSPHPDEKSKAVGELAHYHNKTVSDTIATHVLLPEAFEHTGPNRIVDYGTALRPVMERLHRLRLGISEDTLRILHIGDSHVRGRIFPRTVEAKLTETFGAVSYTNMGVNGATCLTFTHPDRIEAIVESRPELLILSFGTNESHNRRYNATVHYNQMDELVRMLRSRLPETPILLTAPPGSYDSFRQRRRRRTYAVNPRTEAAVRTIRQYAKDRKLAVWDMYQVAGGKDHAARNWWEAGLMRPDHVHYLPEGYVLQGELLFEALINTYNEYVAD